MLTIYNEKKRKICKLTGNCESILRAICENNRNLFSKEVNDEIGEITFKSLENTEAKTNIGSFILWKGYILKFEVS